MAQYNQAVRNAQNIASVGAAAIAAGATQLGNAESVHDAVDLLVNRGVFGEGPFETTQFKVPNLSPAQIAAATRHLHWEEGLLVFKREPAPANLRRKKSAIQWLGEVVERIAKADPEKAANNKDPGNANLAIARAEAVNMATAAFTQAHGKERAEKKWKDAGSSQERYRLIGSFLAFAPKSLGEYMPAGYEIELRENLLPLKKVRLLADGAEIAY